MQDRRSVRGALLRGTPIEVVVENGFHRTVGTGADIDSAVRRRLETPGAIRTQSRQRGGNLARIPRANNRDFSPISSATENSVTQDCSKSPTKRVPALAAEPP
jgi:hypothetical protein